MAAATMPVGSFECVGDSSGGDLGKRFAVITIVGGATARLELSAYAVIFDTPACKLGRSIPITYRCWFDDPER